MKLSLRFYIPVLLVLVAVIQGVMIFYHSHSHIEEELESSSVKELETRMKLLQETLEYLLRNNDLTQVQQHVTALATDASTSNAVLLDDKNRVLASMRVAQIGKSLSEITNLQSSNTIINEELFRSLRYTLKGVVTMLDDGNTILGFHPVILEDSATRLRSNRVGLLIIAKDLSLQKKHLDSELYAHYVPDVAITVLLLGLLGLLLHYLINRKVNGLIVTAESYSDGNYSVRAPESSVQEFSRLASAFNNMASKIEINQRNLLQSKQRLMLHLQNTPLGVIEWDTDFCVAEWNPAAETMFGYSRYQAIGKAAKELIVPESSLHHVDETWYKLLHGEGGLRSTNENITRDGKTIVCDWYNTPLVTDSGQIIGVASVVHDVTRQLTAQEELKKHREHLEELVQERTRELSNVNKELESFSYSVSHDLRTPLRSIDGFSLALLEDYAEQLDETGKGYLQRVRRASQQMGQLIEGLLQLSRLTRGEIKKENVNLSKLAKTVVSDYLHGEQAAKPTVTIQPEIMVHGDKALLRGLLENLLGNAIKYSSKRHQPFIQFGEQQNGDERVFFVRDNGVGFDLQYADKLFEAFQRLHHPQEFEGTGIGLATVQRIVNRHGGRIWAESIQHEGATFYFTLE